MKFSEALKQSNGPLSKMPYVAGLACATMYIFETATGRKRGTYNHIEIIEFFKGKGYEELYRALVRLNDAGKSKEEIIKFLEEQGL